MKSIVDIGISIIILFFVFSGIRKGLIRQVLDVVGIIAAFIGSFYLAHRFAAFIELKINLSYDICLIISAVVLFIGIIIIFHFIALALKKLINMTILGNFDRITGGLFGAIKGILLSSFMLIILFSLPVSKNFKNDLKEDRLVAFVEPVLPTLFDMIISIGPEELDFDKVIRSKKHFINKSRKKADEIKDDLDKKERKLSKTVSETDLLQS